MNKFSFQSEKSIIKFSIAWFQPQQFYSVYIYRWKQHSLQYWLKADLSHWAPCWFWFIQSRPWLLDWTHWLKGNFNDLLSQVLIRCWRTALCGTGHSWGREWTELAGLLLLRQVKGRAVDTVQAQRLTSFPLEHKLCSAVTSSSLCPGQPWLRCFDAFFSRTFSSLRVIVTVLPPYEPRWNERERDTVYKSQGLRP